MYLKIKPCVSRRNMHELGMHLFTARDRKMVKHVVQNSEAYRKVLRPNDRVENINNKPVGNLGEQELNGLMDSLLLKKMPIEISYIRGGEKMKAVLYN